MKISSKWFVYKLLENEQQQEVVKLVRFKRLAPNQVESYKENHRLKEEQVYEKMYPDCQQYFEIMKLFKLSLLITPCAANVERGFSILTLLHTKQQNSLSPFSLDQLMRIVLLGDEKPD